MAKAITSYRHVFRLIFVVFSLYLMGDAFYRWDGFSYFAAFSEFLPAVALVTILWSVVSMFAAMLVWLAGNAMERLCRYKGWKIRTEHLLLFICIITLLGAAVWYGKRLIWQHAPTTSQLKLIVLSNIVLAAIFLTWLFRNKMSVIQERITPLVWLFGILVMLSVPLVVYQTWGGNAVSEKVISSSATDRNRPNIILIIFDTLTARDMSVYGYHRPTTPFISEWAKRASLFRRAQADSNFTSPATATLMTGKRPWTHRRNQTEGTRPVRSRIENLPLVLKNNGYSNMAFIVNYHTSVEKLGISGSFKIADSPISFYSPGDNLLDIIRAHLYRLFGDKIRMQDWIIKEDFILYRLLFLISRDSPETIVPPEIAFNSYLKVIDNNPPEPFFAWIQVFPPHFPYLPPKPYMGAFDSSYGLRTFKSQLKARDKVFRYPQFTQEVQPVIDTFRSRYDEFIRFCDNQFKDFITQLTEKDKLRNTVIILSSDHGESFEHNYVSHAGPHLYEQLTHIPLIIREPGQTEGRIINDLAGQVDIAPTILDLAGIPVPSWMEGRSLVPLLRDKKLPPVPVFSMNFQKNPSRRHLITRGTIAVWEGDYKLIHYLEDDRSLLFNLKQDPDELTNLFDKKTGIGLSLLSLIQDNLAKANERISREE